MNFQEQQIQHNQRDGFEALLYLCRHQSPVNSDDELLVIVAVIVYVYNQNRHSWEDSFDKKSFVYQIKKLAHNNLYISKDIPVQLLNEDTSYLISDFRNIIPQIENLTDFFFTEAGKIVSKNFNEQLLSNLFYDFIIKGNLSLRLRNGRYFTPKLISEKIASLVELKEEETTYKESNGEKSFSFSPTDSVIDIGCGLGGILGEIMQTNPNKGIKYTAVEINANVALLGKMYLSLLGEEFLYKTADAFEYLEREGSPKYDWVVSDAPFDNKEVHFIDLAIKKARKKAILIIPENFLFSIGKKFVNKRKELVDNDWVEAVISYPLGIMKPFSGIKVSLIVINKEKTEKEKGLVRFEEVISKTKNLNAYSSTKDNSFIIENKVVLKTNQEIIHKDYFLNTNRYFAEEINYTSPKSELRTLGEIATLKRGVTARNEYITTINNGCFYVGVKQLSKETELPYFNEANIEYCFDRKESHKFRYANAGEVLVSMYGETLKPTLIQKGFAYYADTVISIKVNNKYLVNPQYLAFYLRSENVKKQLDTFSVTGVIKRINKIDLENIIIEVPDAQEQANYVNEQLSNLFEKEQKLNLEEKARDVLERANTLEHTLGNSINVIGHDLKSLADFFEKEGYDPITNTKARAEVAEKSRLSTIIKRMLLEVQSSIFALENVDDWRIVNKNTLHKEKTNLKRFFEEESNLGELSQGISIEIVCPNNLEAEIDRERFKILIRNFIHNAKKHAFANIELQDKRINFTICKTENGSIQIEVYNNGKAIREDFNLDKNLNSGTNKGLKLIYNIVKAHDGSLKVLSKETSEQLGVGAFFIIEINKLDTDGEN